MLKKLEADEGNAGKYIQLFSKVAENVFDRATDAALVSDQHSCVTIK